jgi:hypothetical protein
MVYACCMRKNLKKIAARLHIGISRDQEHLARLRDDWDHTHEMLEAAQAVADESRMLFEQLRTARVE